MNSSLSGRNYLVSVIVIVFALIYGSISLVNHFLFRTYALDLGMFNQALYCFSHFRANYFTLDVNGNEVNYFGDHFSPITLLFSPLYYVFGSYTLLIIQIVFILAGGIGIYKYACIRHTSSRLPVLLLFQFFCIWGIYFALASDYHNNVIAAMLVPWLFYSYEKDNKKLFLLFFLLILISKENMSLWLGFIMLGLIIKRFMEKGVKSEFIRILKFELPLVLLSFFYFVVIVSMVMPVLDPDGVNPVNRYSQLGNSVSEIFINVFKDPRYIFSHLFESPLNNEMTFGMKSELHFMVLVSGGYALFCRPYYLVMLIPVYFQKFLTNDFGIWGIGGQYSIEFVPLISLCLTDLLGNIKSKKTAWIIALLTTAATMWFTYSAMEICKKPWYNKTNVAFYDKIHYKTHLNIKEINSALRSIPDKVPVSVTSTIAPHLACREKLYHFPVVKDAAYVVLVQGDYYPLTKEDFFKKMNECIEKDHFVLKYDENDLFILKKEP
ncbi:MAG TPA: DUF2079 domain-containing protein [Bacteroidales bacterium]|nr:DUF2079 domain-containing protein [Bacteroidales bacterium]